MGAVTLIGYVLLDLVTIFTMIYCISKMSTIKPKFNLIKIIILIILSSLNVISNLNSPIKYKLIIAFILAIFINKVSFKLKFKDITIFTAFYLIITYILELLLSYLLLFLDLNSLNYINNSIVIKYSLSLVHVLLTLILFKNKTFSNILNKLNKIINEHVLLFILIIIYFLNAITIFRYNTISKVSVIWILGTSIIFLIIIINSKINDKYNINILTNKNKNLKDSYKAYSNTIEECRELKHNLKNDLFSIKSLLPNDKQKIINDLIIKYNKNYEWINKIEEIPEGLQGIIFLKQNEALEKRIKIYINTTSKIDTPNDDYINISSILGILLDNSIEASSKAKKKIIVINISESKTHLNIQIINKYNNDVDINKIGKKNYSTKEIKSGIGLNYIKKIKSPKIKVDFKIINDLFISRIKYKKSIH